jgi:hypothetical protein
VMLRLEIMGREALRGSAGNGLSAGPRPLHELA